MAASILKIVITQYADCDNLVGFLKSGHIQIIILLEVSLLAITHLNSIK